MDNKILLESVRAVGIIKPRFNPTSKGFEPPQLAVLGTGFWLTSGVFVTCAHVIENIENLPIDIVGMLVVGGNGKPYRKATIAITDNIHDLAILTVEPNNDSDNSSLTQEFTAGLSICDKDVSVGERIAYAGFPLGNQLLNEKHSPSYAEGVIGSEIMSEKVGFKTIQISGPVIGGYSGSPIVLKRDPSKVLSMVSRSPSEEAGQASIFQGIHWKHIKHIADLARS